MNTETIIALVISGAALLTSVAGPLITALITNSHERKMYQKRFETEHKHEVIEKYLKSAGKYIFNLKFEDSEEFAEACGEIFMYAPQDMWNDIRLLNEAISILISIDDYHERKSKSVDEQSLYLSICERFSDQRRAK